MYSLCYYFLMTLVLTSNPWQVGYLVTSHLSLWHFLTPVMERVKISVWNVIKRYNSSNNISSYDWNLCMRLSLSHTHTHTHARTHTRTHPYTDILCVYVCVWERERERDRQAEREGERDRQTDRQTDRQREREWVNFVYSATRTYSGTIRVSLKQSRKKTESQI